MNQHISISDKLCKFLNVNIYDHFRGVTKMIVFDSESKRLANAGAMLYKTRKPSSC